MDLPLRDGPAGSPPAGTAPDGPLASLALATAWLNTRPLVPGDLRGRVVLVQFWTYTCINWLRTLAHVRAWHERYARHGLVVVGVHSPEFDVERDVANVRRATHDLGVSYPVALDGHHGIWDAFGNDFWPALYLFDAEGRGRHHSVGEGGEDRAELVLRALLVEAGTRDLGPARARVRPRGVELPADWDEIGSAETYLGYGRAENFAARDGAVRDVRHVYPAPPALRLNAWTLAGDWTLRRDAAVLNRAGGRVLHRFRARDVHLVMGTVAPDSRVRFRVTLDGLPPGRAHGVDVDAGGDGLLSVPRLYQLVRQPPPVTERTFGITFLAPGARAYALTFG